MRRTDILRPLAALLIALLFGSSGLAQDSGSSSRWFEVETLNEGLGAAPEWLDRSTPQGAMESFIVATDVGDFADAAHLLDLRGIESGEQPDLGPALARMLSEVIERRYWIDWDELPDRPDALLQSASDRVPMAGEPRRSLRLAIFELDSRPVPLRLNRLKPAEGDAVWVFSQQSVDNIAALHARFGPGWFELRLPDGWRSDSWFGLKRWELVVLPALIVLAAGVFLLARWLFGVFARRAPWQMARNAAEAARTPLALFIAAALPRQASEGLFTFSAQIDAVLRPLLLAAMVIAVTIAVLRALDSLLDVVTRRYVGGIDDEESSGARSFYTSIYALRRVVLLIAVVVGVGVVMAQLHLFKSLGVSLLASAGVVTVILGIAGQTVLGNILASLQIAMAKPIRIGDSVFYEGDWAYVEAIFYTFVRLRTWDNRRLIVPVQYFISNPFENWSMQDAKMTRTFILTVDHAAKVDALRDAFLDIAAGDEDVMDDEMMKVLVTGHSSEGKDVRFYATAPDPTKAWNMHCRLREQTLAWIEENHPEWWPRERVLDVGGGDGTRGGAIDD